MTQCREFEDNLYRYFSDTDFQSCRDASATGDWSAFVPVDEFHQSLLRHVSACDDCATSLLWYLDIKDVADYREYPCLHFAYFCNDDEDRCIDYLHGLFSVILDKDKRTGIVIGFCPWCGIQLNVSGA